MVGKAKDNTTTKNGYTFFVIGSVVPSVDVHRFIKCMCDTCTGWEPVNIREFERHAQLMLSKNAFDYYASGANDMVTLRENR